MLWAKAQVTFFGLDKGREAKYYYAAAVSDFALRFSNDLRVLGFVREHVSEKYVWGEEYPLILLIPSIDGKNIKQVKNEIEDHRNIDICVGSKTMGRVKIVDWELMPNDYEHFERYGFLPFLNYYKEEADSQSEQNK